MEQSISIGLIGDYDTGSQTHKATEEALLHAAGDKMLLSVQWVPTWRLAEEGTALLFAFDALWCAPGSPYRSLEGALSAIRYAREQDIPLLGTCGGFQHMALEFARDVLNVKNAASVDYEPDAPSPFIAKLACPMPGKVAEVKLHPNSRTYRIYGKSTVREEFRCSLGVNPRSLPALDEAGFKVVGIDDEKEARILELPSHRFYLATLFLPQLRSSADSPHPIIRAFLEAAVGGSKLLH